MGDPDLSRVPEGGTLRVLQSGLVIVRRRKHEPLPTFDLPREDLRRQTGKVAGSKFAPEWGLQQLVDWLEDFLVTTGWPFQPGDNRSQSVRLAAPATGLAPGQAVVLYDATRVVGCATIAAEGVRRRARP